MDIEKKLEILHQRLITLPPFHPGKLSQQYVRCGKENCHCRDEKNPKKHGPYYQLSYAVRGKKNSTVFIKEEQVAIVKKSLDTYDVFKNTIDEIVDLTAQHVRAKQLGKNT
jgi:hypothetical protein